LTDLEDIRDGYVAKLKALAEGDTKLTYSADGRSYDWTGYQKFLQEQIRKINVDIINASGGPEIRTQAIG
jgi:hypothetical protein